MRVYECANISDGKPISLAVFVCMWWNRCECDRRYYVAGVVTNRCVGVPMCMFGVCVSVWCTWVISCVNIVRKRYIIVCRKESFNGSHANSKWNVFTYYMTMRGKSVCSVCDDMDDLSRRWCEEEPQLACLIALVNDGEHGQDSPIQRLPCPALVRIHSQVNHIAMRCNAAHARFTLWPISASCSSPFLAPSLFGPVVISTPINWPIIWKKNRLVRAHQIRDNESHHLLPFIPAHSQKLNIVCTCFSGNTCVRKTITNAPVSTSKLIGVTCGPARRQSVQLDKNKNNQSSLCAQAYTRLIVAHAKVTHISHWSPFAYRFSWILCMISA